MEEKIKKIRQNINGLLAHYNLGNFNDLSWAEGGFTNENYIVETSSGKIFLKKYLRGGQEKISREHKLLEYLKDELFPVPKLIHNNNSQTLTEYNGDFYTFFEFIPGYTRVATNTVTDAELMSMAETLAKYHHLAKRIPMSIEPLVPILNKSYLDNLYAQTKNILTNKLGLDDFDKEIDSILDRKTRELEEAEDINDAALPLLLTHGDFHAANLKFKETGEVAAVFDWELAKYQPRIWEVVCAMIFCAKEAWTWNFHTPIDFPRAQKFLSAYNSVNPLSEPEINALPKILKSASADLSWPLKEHYVHNNFASDRFLPKKTEHWFFWNDENISKLKEAALATLPSQPKLI